VTEADVEATTDLARLKEWWQAHPTLRPAIEARVTVLKATETGGE